MRGKLLTKLVSVAIALAMLASLATVALAESGGEEPTGKVFIVSFNMDHYIKNVETEAGTPVKKPDIKPEREGYVFSYWFVKGDIYQEPYDFSLPVTGSLKLEPLFLLQAPAIDPTGEDDKDDANGKDPAPEGTDGDPADTLPPSDDPPAGPGPDDPAPTDPDPTDPDPDDPDPNDLDPQDPDPQDPDPDDPDPQDPDDPADDDDGGDENDLDDDEKQTEVLLPERSIRIWSDAPDKVRKGHLITLYSEMTGYGDCVLSLRWQFSTDGGATWQDAVGGTGYTYTYAASKELSKCLWHLCVTVLEEPRE